MVAPMNLSLFAALRRPLTVWLALWVTLLAALAPTATHALQTWSDGGPGSADLCSAAKPLNAATGASQGQTLTGEHCPLCVLSLERSAPPTAERGSLAPTQAGHEIALRPSWVSVCARELLAAAPRGPPATS